jgi:hypothetical protein
MPMMPMYHLQSPVPQLRDDLPSLTDEAGDDIFGQENQGGNESQYQEGR